ncbi:BTAD domain-containing putative transcriptional regulator [Intrasporangium calvum]|uniref:BTAD domain-containing putative transcriptional regulator n=1 Tax=Intrasporangium calvum TaxID=53358 RepID=A0ABT5GKE6_9MICO|nr:BTAD domain-containing putative transcriptional regulator [Intrasporangium calvum]MDC5698553.1 BTAD domain-containing putative transcriptional regulator [Intrasporangium calvum]
MDFSVLGPLRVANGAGPIEVPGAKERALLAHLVARRGSMVPASEIIDALWGDEPPRSAAKSVQTFVARLRNALDPERASGTGVILTEGPGYRLDVDASAVDAERFVGLLTVGRTALRDGRDRVASEALGDALALWRGPAYAGFETASWAQAEARRLEELRLDAADDLLAVRLDLGHTAEVIAEAERRLGEQPLRERIWCLLVLALYRAGRQADALAAYERARTTLAEELGVDPGPELRELHAKVLAHDPALRGRAQSAALPAELQVPGDGFVGREDELDRLRELWASVEAGGSVSVAVRGPEGAGASRLAAELARGVVRSGASVAFVGPSTPPSGRMPLGSPALVVADHVVAESPQDGMLLRLVGAGEAAAGVDEVIDLHPLAEREIRLLAAKYVPAADLDAAVAEVRSAGAAWPGVVHDAVAQRARRLAAQQVESAVRTATVSREALVSARDALSDGVETLAESARADVMPSDEAPWPGLQPYGQDEARFFAGRERLVAELVARLATTRLLAVVGASGTGKSSLVQAGLVPALEAGVLPGSASWVRLTMRPGSAPLRELARVALGGRQVDVGDVLAQLLSRAGGRDATAEGAAPRTVLVVDQFEEVWTSGADDAQVADFLRVLVDAVDDPAGRVSVVVVLRADYLTAVAEHPELARRLSESTVLVGAPTPDEVRRAVERPADRARITLEDGLADAIVTDAGAEPGLLPLLSTSMRRLWEDRTAGMLTFASYVGSGGLRGAIAHLAEDAFTALPTGQQDAARTLLLRLAGPGEGVAVTRRRVALAELEALPSPDQRRVADRLAEARLLTISDGFVEVAHEALFREWPRLSGWLAEDATSRAVQRRLTLAANEWDAEGREDAALWRGTRLAGALELVSARPDEVTSVEQDFVEAARERAEAEQREVAERAARTARQNRRLRALLIGAAVLLVVALVAGLLAWRSSAEATAASERATAASISADAKRLAATALNEEYPDVAMLAALESVRIERSPETYGALLTLLARAPEVVFRNRIEGRFLRQAVSPDGRVVLLTDNGSTLYAYDADSGEARWQVESEGPQFSFPTFSPDGTRLAVQPYGATQSLQVRSATDGALRWSKTLKDLGRESRAGSLDDMADGVVWLDDSTLAVVAATQWLEVDADTGAIEKAHPWPQRLNWLTTVRDFGGGRFVVDVEEGQTLVIDRDRPTDNSRRLDGFVFGDPRNGRAVTLVENIADNTMTVTPLRSTRDLRPSGAPVTVDGFAPWASFSPDGSQLILSVDSRIEVRDGRTGALRRTLVGHSGQVMQASVAGAKHDLVWTAGRDGTTVAFDLSANRGTIRSRQVPTPEKFSLGEAVGDIAVGIGSHQDRFNPAHLVDVTTGKDLFGELPLGECPEECQAAAVAMGPDGRTAYGSIEHLVDLGPGTAGALVAWDVATGRTTATWPTPWPVYALDVAADGRTVLLNGRFGWGLMDLSSGDLLWESERQAELNWYGLPMATASPDGRWAVLGRKDSWTVLDLRAGRVVATRNDAGAASSFTWSADFTTLVVGTMGGRVHFVDPATLRDRAPSRLVVGGFVIDLETSPDGRLFASLGSDGDTMLWDAATARPYGRPLTGTRMWGTLSFSEDSGTLRVLFDNATRTDIDVHPDAWVRSGCRVAGRDLTPEESAVLRPGQPPRSTCDGLT